MICIIPARGGSKRLPGKNIRQLDGEFIINRVIRIAEESGLFSDIIVSTDSLQIAHIAESEVSIRPEEISGDIPEDDVLKWTAQYWGDPNICRIYPFAVLLTPERLRAGYEQFKTGNYENVHECQRYTHTPLRSFTLGEGYMYPQLISKPIENLPPRYHDAATYMFSSVSALDTSLEDRNIYWLPVSEMEAQDLDDADDWDMLELKWKYGKIGRKP